MTDQCYIESRDDDVLINMKDGICRFFNLNVPHSLLIFSWCVEELNKRKIKIEKWEDDLAAIVKKNIQE